MSLVIHLLNRVSFPKGITVGEFIISYAVKTDRQNTEFEYS